MRILNKIVRYERQQLAKFDQRIVTILENMMIRLYRDGRHYIIIPTYDTCMAEFKEIAEFLDGNGFMVDYEDERIKIYFNPIFGVCVDELNIDEDE